MTIDSLQRDIVKWADGINAGRTPENTVVKMVSETSELLDAIVNRAGIGAVASELGDCMILLLDLADMFEVDLVAAAEYKMTVNKNRQWYADEHGVIRRKKE